MTQPRGAGRGGGAWPAYQLTYAGHGVSDHPDNAPGLQTQLNSGADELLVVGDEQPDHLLIGSVAGD